MKRRKRPYEVQLERTIRWKTRIENTIIDYRQGKITLSPLEFSDMIWSFFVCCYHVKDFIENDDRLIGNFIVRIYLNQYIKRNDCLKVSYDICIGVKHLKVNHPKTSGGPFSINLIANRDDATGKMLFDVNMKSKTIKENLSKLMNDCILTWEEFFRTEIPNRRAKQIKKICPICHVESIIDEDLELFDCPNCKTENLFV